MRSLPPARKPSVLAAAGVAGLVFLTACDGPTRMIIPETPSTALPPPCPGFSLQVAFLGQGGTDEIARGELTLDAEDPGASLIFHAPYTIQIPDGGANLDVPGLRPTVGFFVSDLRFETVGEGFRQSMTVEWLSELKVEATEAGCDPITVTCDLGGCASP